MTARHMRNALITPVELHAMSEAEVLALVAFPNDELYHYGIKGMKWGHRKAPVKVSADSKRASMLRKKKISELSNAELRDLNTRMELERRYAQMNPSTASKGYTAIKTTLAVAGTFGAVAALPNNPAVKLGRYWINWIRNH